MESTLQNPAVVAAKLPPKAELIIYRTATALFCLQMAFTAYAQLRLPQVAEAFTHLGFPAYFRVELSLAKLLGLLVLLAPVPGRLKEWAYAGFAIDLASAVIAHVAVGDDAHAWGWAAGDRRAGGPLVLLLAAPAGRAVAREHEPPMKKVATTSSASPSRSASALIDERIASLRDWRGERLAWVRGLIHEADPEVVEEWKWMGTPIWSHGGIICTGETYKSVVKMTFARGASLKDPPASSIPASMATSGAPSTFTKARRSMRRP